MAYLEEIIDTKNDIVNKLITNEIIVQMLDTKVESPDELIGKNIFKDLYIPDTQSEAKTYICLGVFVNKIQNQIIKYLEIHFWIFSHQNVMDTGLGYTRVDKIQSEIDKIMNGSYQFGIDQAQLKGSYQYKVLQDFTGVELVYDVPNLNEDTRFAVNKYDR
jgi:hypothetical protein